MALDAIYISHKIAYKAIPLFSFNRHTCDKSTVVSKNVKQYLISCPALLLRYVSLNSFSEKTFSVKNCFSPHV